MFLTARQLDDLHRQSGGNGHLTLPYRARLTPMAADWVKAKKIALGYSDVAVAGNGAAKPGIVLQSAAVPPSAGAPAQAGTLLWWCDGPCGPAKAALVAEEKQSSLRAMEKPADPKQIVAVIKSLAADVKANRAAGGILLMQNGAAAMVFANRCPSLRAVLGTCLEAVEQGVRQVGANVLVIEYPHKTLPQVRNLLSRFVRGPRNLSEDARRQIEELASCA